MPMKTVVIENPIINSPFEEPRRHWVFDDAGITNTIKDERRKSSYFIPIAQPRKRDRQLTLETQWTLDRLKDNDDINYVRGRVERWRRQAYPDITPVTRLLLEHWKEPDREQRRFFCQIEALETMIFLTEAAAKHEGQPILNRLRDCAEAAPGF